MEDFFDSIYYFTSGLYCKNLDNYLYDTVQGYLHIGLAMVILSILSSVFLYYVLKPVSRQKMIWALCVGVNCVLNFFVALGYTITPLINNSIDDSDSWSLIDTFFFGFSNMIWAFVFFIVTSLIIKWWSPAKYVPGFFLSKKKQNESK